MNIQFHGQEEGRVHFGNLSRSTTPDEREKGVAVDEQVPSGSSPSTADRIFRGESMLDGLSQEESRVLIGIQQRQNARERQGSQAPLLPEPLIARPYYSDIPEVHYSTNA